MARFDPKIEVFRGVLFTTKATDSFFVFRGKLLIKVGLYPHIEPVRILKKGVWRIFADMGAG
jgi:hypothetical protein